MEFVLFLLFGVVSFALGYWVASHPEDARTIAQRARDAFGRLVNRVERTHMSWLTKLFRSIFGRRPDTEPFPAPSNTVMGTPPSQLPPHASRTPMPPTPTTPVDPRWPYGTKTDGTPFTSQAEADDWRRRDAERTANLDDWQTHYDAEVYGGPVAVESLTPQEKQFLMYAERNFSLSGRTQLFYAICNGPKARIDEAIAWADAHYGEYDAAAYQGRMRDYVEQFKQGLLVPKTN